MLCSTSEMRLDSSLFLFQNLFNGDSHNEENFEYLDKMKLNSDSGIIVLNQEEERQLLFFGRYLSMHSWAEISLTPNLGYLIGELNLINEIKKFIFSTSLKYFNTSEYINFCKNNNIKFQKFSQFDLSCFVNRNISENQDIFFIKGTLQIYAIRYFATDSERNDFDLENKLYDAITEIIKTLKAGTLEK